MIIVSSCNPGSLNRQTKKILLLTGIGTTLIIPTFLIILGAVNQPTGTLVSPLPQGELTQATPTIPAKNFNQSINLAQNFFTKAISLSKNQNQTETDKQEIITSLNESLNHINNAINSEPQNPAGYLLRSQILASLGKINPNANQAAATDLEIAQKLSQGQEVNLPQAQNPIDLIPNQQASLAQNIIIAAPATESAIQSGTDTATDTTKGSVILPARKKEVVINNPKITSESSIYLTPKNQTEPVFIKSQTNGQAVIGTNNPISTDLTIDYWITK
jgi:hypothetical protein